MRFALLKELCDIRHGGTPPKSVPAYWSGNIPWVSPKDMKAATVSDASDRISEAAVANSATSIAPSGSTLLVVRSGILAHTLPVAMVTRPVAFNQDIKAVVPKSADVSAAYVYWFLRSQASGVVARGVKKGATVHSVQSGFIETLRIPVLTSDEQQRVVDLLTRTEGIVRLRREAQQRAAELIPAIFVDMFGDPATNPKGWTERALGAVVDEFRYGTSQKSGEQGYPTLRIPNVIGNALDLGGMKFVAVPTVEADRIRLVDGDLLFVRTNGNPDYVGRCAVYDAGALERAGFDGKNCLYASYLIRARLDQRKVAPTFLQAFLSSAEGRTRIRGQARTSAGQYNINTQGLASVVVPVPTLELQKDFVRCCQSIMGLVELQSAASQKATTAFEGLLARTFLTEGAVAAIRKAEQVAS